MAAHTHTLTYKQKANFRKMLQQYVFNLKNDYKKYGEKREKKNEIKKQANPIQYMTTHTQYVIEFCINMY
jgi:hypothetical protein